MYVVISITFTYLTIHKLWICIHKLWICVFSRGNDTILGETSDPQELFLVDDCQDTQLTFCVAKAKVRDLRFRLICRLATSHQSAISACWFIILKFCFVCFAYNRVTFARVLSQHAGLAF